MDENTAHGVLGWSMSPPTGIPWKGFSPQETALLQNKGFVRPKVVAEVVRGGLEIYQPEGDEPLNSAIQYVSTVGGETGSGVTCGRLLRIVQDGPVDGVYAIVDSFEQLPDAEKEYDPFRRYPELEARLYKPELSGKPEIIPLGECL